MTYINGFLCVLCMLLMIGCSSSESSESPPLMPEPMLSVSGQLRFSDPSSSLLVTNYQLFVQDKLSHEYRLIDIDDEGGFMFSSPSNDDVDHSYFFGIVEHSEDQFNYVAPVIYPVDDEGSILRYTIVDVTEDIETIEIEFDSEGNSARFVSLGDQAQMSSEGTVTFPESGFVSSGEGAVDIGSSSGLDRDQDGVPNLFDTRHGDLLNPFHPCSANRVDNVTVVSGHPSVKHVKVLTFYESINTTTANVSQNLSYGLFIEPIEGAGLTFSDVEFDPQFNEAKISLPPTGFSSPEGSSYPQEGASFDSFYRVESDSADQMYGVFLNFPSTVSVSNHRLIAFKVTDANNISRQIVVQLNIFFESYMPPVTFQSNEAIAGTGALTNPFQISSSKEYVIEFTKPNKRNGAPFDAEDCSSCGFSNTYFNSTLTVVSYDDSGDALGTPVLLDSLQEGPNPDSGKVIVNNLSFQQLIHSEASYAKVFVTLRSPAGHRFSRYFYVRYDNE